MPSQPEPLVVAEPENIVLPQGRDFWLDDSMFATDRKGLPIPHFSVQSVAQVFFGNGPDWLRWRMRGDPENGRPHGYFLLNGVPLEFKRTDAGARYFTLADVERMATALCQEGGIDGLQLSNITMLVKYCARVNGVGV